VARLALGLEDRRDIGGRGYLADLKRGLDRFQGGHDVGGSGTDPRDRLAGRHLDPIDRTADDRGGRRLDLPVGEHGVEGLGHVIM
jgi:hypothetical protein